MEDYLFQNLENQVLKLNFVSQDEFNPFFMC